MNCLDAAVLPISTPSRVLAKSSGYTKHVVMQPEHPPAKMLLSRKIFLLFLDFSTLTTLYIGSLNEKFNA